VNKFLKENFVLLCILAAAAIFRFVLIDSLPGGLFPDEAANGLDVNSILSGDLKPFYERGNGREALFFYIISVMVAYFGRGPWQHHAVSASFGFFAVLATYFLTKRLFGKNVAYLTAFFMSVSSFAVTISRTAFRANLVPLFTTLTILFIVKTWQETDPKKRYWPAALAGISFALGFYTYISYRMMIPLLIAFKLVLIIAYRDRIKEILREYWKPKLIAAAAFLVTIFPLAHYFWTHPGSFVGRAGHVSIFSRDLNDGDVLGTLWRVFKLTILGFFTDGDINWRHNVSGFPFLSPVLSIFFAVSLVVFTVTGLKFLKDAWQKKLEIKTFSMALIAAWFWAMLVPEVTTAEGIPHGLRLIGVMPAMFIMAAWSVNWVWEKLRNYTGPHSRTVIAMLFLSFIFIYNFALYFGVAANSPEYYYAFRSDLTVVSGYLNKYGNQSNTFLSLDKFSVQTVDYLTTETGNPYTLVNPADTWQLKLQSGDQVVFTMSTLFDRIRFRQYHPDAKIISQVKNRFGQVIMEVYQEP